MDMLTIPFPLIVLLVLQVVILALLLSHNRRISRLETHGLDNETQQTLLRGIESLLGQIERRQPPQEE